MRCATLVAVPDQLQSPLPFEDSRRLTGPCVFFPRCGVVLEAVQPMSGAVEAGWRTRVTRMQCAMNWSASKLVVRRHQHGVSLAFPAPVDVLFTATEVNEWALLASLGVAMLHAPGYPASWDEAAAVLTLRAMERAERQPALVAVLQAAALHSVSTLLDDDTLTVGGGRYSVSWPRRAPPALEQLDWSQLHSVPTTLVTGSNGKTTTVRLIAAMQRAHGLRCGHSCTDGVMIDGQPVAAGDYSGPAGARTVLRDPRVEAAVLETARGGLLRRGLAVEHASVAVVTNVSADHFGEYGIDDLAGLAEAKLTVARALGPEGSLVVNADDLHLVARAASLGHALAWFAQDLAHPLLQAHRAQGGATCGVSAGHLCLAVSSREYSLGEVAQLPLCADGLALYNIGNCAAAALAAYAQGVPVETIAAVLADFGRQPSDNPGRLERYQFGGVQLLVDYAHNPEGLDGLLKVAAALRTTGRLALLLGQAGNRKDADILRLADVAASYRPELVVLKGVDGYERGRPAGEVPRMLHDALVRHGYTDSQLPLRIRELDAVRTALEWAQAGDVLVLAVHSLSARGKVGKLIVGLREDDWRPGQALPLRCLDRV